MSEKSKREIDKQALDESIIKWEAIVGEYEKGNEIIKNTALDIVWKDSIKVPTGISYDDCPLCILYHPDCDDCPLSEADDECDIGYENTWGEYYYNRDLATATAMLNKLKELRRAYD